MILSDDFGIDLGSDSIKIYDPKNDQIYTDKDMAAVRKTGTVIAVGEEAYMMQGSTPKSIKIQVPITAGRINDVVLLDAVLESLLYKNRRFLGIKPRLFFAVPSDMTEIERRAYASLSRRGRLKNCSVFLIERNFADAIALGISPEETRGTMIVNMGAEMTDASVISDKRIILCKTIPVAGNSINKSILNSVRTKNSLAIGLKTAEGLKKNFCDLTTTNMTGASVSGLDTITGLPRDGYITERTVRAAVYETLDELGNQLDEFVRRIPPQVLEKVKTEGIYLTGGSSYIEGSAKYLADRLNLPVNLSSHYDKCTVNGLKIIMNNSEYEHLAYTPLSRK